MKNINFLIKPASSLCNMRCRYCFYSDEAALRNKQKTSKMTLQTAELLIQKAFSAAEPSSQVSFSFQGGEPTLAGLDFFRFFVRKVQELCPPNVEVHYAFQSNGLLIDEEWARFFTEHHFLVGISLDASKEFHDSARIDSCGKGTWNRVTASLRTLQKYEAEVNLLCVVNRQIARHPQKVYSSLRKFGIPYLQFIACLDPLEGKRGKELWSLTPKDYGAFLCGLFDAYYQDWASGNYTSVRLFDDYVQMAMGFPPGSCAACGNCGAYFVVEGDGTVYPCDFFCLDEWNMGNLCQQNLSDLASGQTARRFLQYGKEKPAACSSCRWYPLCRGGCKRDWTRESGRLENYFCPAFQRFFSYAESRILEIARTQAPY